MLYGDIRIISWRAKNVLRDFAKEKIMKKILKIILTIFCWICAIFLLVETVKSFNYIDDWGLGFTFFTLPIGILGILFLIEAVDLTKELMIKKNSSNL